MDTDLPTLLEAKLFCTTFGKFCWVLLQPFFYAFRPLVTYPKPPTVWELLNLIIQLSFDAFVIYFFGEEKCTEKDVRLDENLICCKLLLQEEKY